MKEIAGLAIIIFLGYSIIGTGTRVDEIRAKVPESIAGRSWKIIRYEGYQYGSWCNHGGKVWYHVKDLKQKNTYYRVYVTIWGNELQYNYGEPETLNRVDLEITGDYNGN